MQNTELLEKIQERQLLLGHSLRGSAGEELKTIIDELATQRNTGRGRKRITWYDSSKEITGTGMKRERWCKMSAMFPIIDEVKL